MNSQTDIQLMMRVREGELDCLAVLFERHHASLFRFYLYNTRDKAKSEDLVQEVFLRILKYRHTFRGEGQFTTWMFQIARNAQIDQAKRWSRETPLEENFDRAGEDPRGSAEYNENIELLQSALAQLQAEKREILILSKFQNLKYDAIAEILDCSVDAVKVRVHRAVNDLRKIFFELSGE